MNKLLILLAFLLTSCSNLSLNCIKEVTHSDNKSMLCIVGEY